MKNVYVSALLVGRSNSIGAVRLLMASLVLVGHSFVYGGFSVDPLAILTSNQVAIGRFPVDVFFALSGFLISASFDKASSPRSFLWHRFIRIYPAYWVCIALTGLVVAPALASFDAPYLYRNITLINGVRQAIPGLFASNPGGDAVNSSLWTLPWELRAYFLVFIVGMAGQLSNKKLLAGLFLAAWAAFAWVILHQADVHDMRAIVTWPRLIAFFVAGMAMYAYRDHIVLSRGVAALALALLVGGTVIGPSLIPLAGGVFYLIGPVCLTYVTFYVSSLPYFSRINSRYDVSYGLYIYGALVLQVLAALGLNRQFVPYLALAAVCTAVLATLSWFLIEKPALGYKRLVK